MTIVEPDAALEVRAHPAETAAPPQAAPTVPSPRLWAHLLGLMVVVAVVVGVGRVRVPFSTDDTEYGQQVAALDAGSWHLVSPERLVGVPVRWAAVANATITDQGIVPYAHKPVYAMALHVMSDRLGSWAIHVIPALGVLGCAAAAWGLARRCRVDPVMSFWITASGPVLLNGTMLWAIAPFAALAAAALLAALAVDSRRSWPAVIGCSVALVAGVLTRDEGVFVTVACAGLVAWRSRPGLLRVGSRAAVVAGPAAVAWLAERHWAATIMGQARALVRRSGPSYLPGRLVGSWYDLLRPSTVSALTVVSGLVAVALVAGFGLAAARGSVSIRMAQVAVFASAANVAVQLSAPRLLPMTGLLAAWPIGILGLAMAARQWRGRGERAQMAGWMAVVTLCLLATMYSGGGGAEWGGRFFAALYAPLAVFGAYGVGVAARSVRGRDRGEGVFVRRLGFIVVLALSVVPTLHGLAIVRLARGGQASLVAAMAAPGNDVVLTDSDWVASLDWVDVPKRRTVLRVGRSELDRALAMAELQGVDVTVAWPLSHAADLRGRPGTVELLDTSMADIFYGVWVVEAKAS